jgi:DNA-binding MurR/RpiR family transcriptional regulator
MTNDQQPQGDARGQDGASSGRRNRRPLLVSMQGLLPTLHRKERMIAEYILADPERVISSSIAEIREGCGASVGAIVAFCRRMGLEGFASFKIELARELAQSGLTGDGAGTERSQTLFEKVFRFHANSLTETQQINSEETLQEAARLLAKARRIEFFSIGISYGVAYTARCKLKLIGLPAYTEFDSHMQVVAATQLKAGDVGFGISCSGSTRETVECLRIARAKKATTICLTNSMKSPMTEYADLALYATPSEVKYFQAPMASRVTQLAVVDALFVYLALKRKDKTAANLQNAGEELLKRRLK